VNRLMREVGPVSTAVPGLSAGGVGTRFVAREGGSQGRGDFSPCGRDRMPAAVGNSGSAPHAGLGADSGLWRRCQSAVGIAQSARRFLNRGAANGYVHAPGRRQKVRLALNWIMRLSSVSEGWSHKEP